MERLTGRYAINLGEDQRLVSQLPGGNANYLAISPDGTHLVYVARQSDAPDTQFYLRAVDQFEARPIPGTENATHPFFSPDSQWIGFMAGNELKKVSVVGGSPMSLCTVPSVALGKFSWGEKGTIVFGSPAGLYQVADSGGEPQLLTTLDSEAGVTVYASPHFLPGGEDLLWNQLGIQKIWLFSSQTGTHRELLEGNQPWYVSSGHIVYAIDDSLFAVAFDIDQLKVTGSPFPLAEKPRISSPTSADFAFSDKGSFVYAPALKGSDTLVWVDREGKEDGLVIEGDGVQPRLSPDGQKLTLLMGQGVNRDVWVYDLNRGTRIRLTVERIFSRSPIWTPDGDRVTFGSGGGDAPGIYWKRADGTGDAELLLTTATPQTPGSWSPDGQTLAFEDFVGSIGSDIKMLSLEGDHSDFLATPFNETTPRFSPDGRWLAYVSNESGRSEIYVLPYPGAEARWPISTNGGIVPVWSRNGSELFYLQGGQVMVVAIQAEPTFTAEKPRPLFVGPYSGGGSGGFDVSLDGQRFVMVKRSETSANQIHVITNWFEELKRLVPTN
jgi:serine/threonine-protein kinase